MCASGQTTLKSVIEVFNFTCESENDRNDWFYAHNSRRNWFCVALWLEWAIRIFTHCDDYRAIATRAKIATYLISQRLYCGCFVQGYHLSITQKALTGIWRNACGHYVRRRLQHCIATLRDKRSSGLIQTARQWIYMH